MEMLSFQYTFVWIPVFFSILAALRIRSRRSAGNLPPSPRGIPVIGHLHLLKRPVHRTLQQISQKLGPVYSLRFGSRLVVVVSSPSAVKECFTTNDIVLANRPQLLNGKYLAYDNTTVATAAYGEHWRDLRRTMALEMFSTSRLNSSASQRREEIDILLRGLSSGAEFARVHLGSELSALSFNILLRMIAGKRYYGQGGGLEAKEFRELMSDLVKLRDEPNPGDFLSFMRWVDYKGKGEKLQRRMDAILQGLVDEHRRPLDHTAEGDTTVIHRLLRLQESQPEYHTDTVIKGLVLVTILAGADSTSVTMEWAMSNLLNHPEMLKKAQAELDTHVGQDRLVEESDLPKLKYLEAIISETLRLFPAGPLLLPHMSSDNCKISGYDVPRNTILLVNVWAIHRDPNIWDDPTSFKPERFEGTDGEEMERKLIAFGLGRRACPGAGFAHRAVGLALGSLIQCFEWKRVDEKAVDLNEGDGIVMPKLIPLEAMCKDRNINIMKKKINPPPFPPPAANV